MKAIQYTQYGDVSVLMAKDIKDISPKQNEVKIKIYKASLTTADTMMRRGRPYLGRLMLGVWKPKFSGLGTGFAGIVEETGDKVNRFKKGDAVFGECVFGTGTHAEYVCISEDAVIVKKPNNLDMSGAASICDGALTALNFIKLVSKAAKGQNILINGASGSQGIAAIQIAAYYGLNVTAVCSEKNHALVSSLGAEYCIDYKKQDITLLKKQFDVIYDTVGKSSFLKSKHLLKKHGIYMSPVFGFKHLVMMGLTKALGGKEALFSATGMLPTQLLNDLLFELIEMIKQGSLIQVTDKEYPFNEIAQAHQYVETGHKVGNVIIDVNKA